MRRAWLATVLATAVTVSARIGAQHSAIDPITEWSVTASHLATTSGMAPLRAPITLALIHLAMYDAVRAVEQQRGPTSISRVAAVVEAGYQMMLAEFPAHAATSRATYERLLTQESDADARANGSKIGGAVAAALLRARARDGRNATVPYTQAAGGTAWVPTPPAFLAENTAFLARVTPFTMDSPSGERPNGPPLLGSQRWADDYNEVKRLGSKSSRERTAKDTATAWFWEPLAGTVWPATIRRLAQEQDLDVPQSARFQAAAFVAFADALIACWDAKYHFNFWRPVTAIRQGDGDGNDQTEPDAGWEPLGVTPNFPEYASGHVCATAAVALTIESFFASRVPIPARNVVTGEERMYRRAADVIDEVVAARMLLGVHFRSADEDGADIGRRIAGRVRQRFLK